MSKHQFEASYWEARRPVGLCRLSPVGRFLLPASRLLAVVQREHRVSPRPSPQPAHPQLQPGACATRTSRRSRSGAWSSGLAKACEPRRLKLGMNRSGKWSVYPPPVWRAAACAQKRRLGWGAAPIISRLFSRSMFSKSWTTFAKKAVSRAPSQDYDDTNVSER